MINSKVLLIQLIKINKIEYIIMEFIPIQYKR